MPKTITSTAGQGHSLASYFEVTDIFPNQKDISHDELIRTLLLHIARKHNLSCADCHLKEIMDNVSDTILPNGVAVPHVRIDDIDKPLIAVATAPEGIDFVAGEDKVHIVVLILIPRDQPILYMKVLRTLSTVLRKRKAVTTAAKLKSAAELMNFFESDGLHLPMFIFAEDLMRKDFVTLHSSDNLKTAIDCFIAEGMGEIPVIDDDGDLISVVNAGTLLRVCLPEYLLWMSDLSPIINFEPFTNVIKNEENTCLSDIMHTDFANVQDRDPAVSVAGELTRRKAFKCYVLKDKKLVGVIDLPLFLNKVFRE